MGIVYASEGDAKAEDFPLDLMNAAKRLAGAVELLEQPMDGFHNIEPIEPAIAICAEVRDCLKQLVVAANEIAQTEACSIRFLPCIRDLLDTHIDDHVRKEERTRTAIATDKYEFVMKQAVTNVALYNALMDPKSMADVWETYSGLVQSQGVIDRDRSAGQ